MRGETACRTGVNTVRALFLLEAVEYSGFYERQTNAGQIVSVRFCMQNLAGTPWRRQASRKGPTTDSWATDWGSRQLIASYPMATR